MSAHRILSMTLAFVLCGAVSIAAAAAESKDPRKAPPPPAPPTGSQPRSELLYVPVPACRIANTGATGNTFLANTTRSFTVRGTAGFPAQGGKSGGCGIPDTATAVAVSTTVTSYSQGGYMMARDTAGTGLTRFTAYGPNAFTTVPPVFPLAATEPSLSIYAGPSGNTHLQIDAIGYYIPPIAGMISSGGGLYSGTSRLISATRNSAGSYTLKVDRDVTYCTVNAQAYSYGYEAHAYLFNNTTVSVYSFSRGAGTTTLQDDYVYVHITC